MFASVFTLFFVIPVGFPFPHQAVLDGIEDGIYNFLRSVLVSPVLVLGEQGKELTNKTQMSDCIVFIEEGDFFSPKELDLCNETLGGSFKGSDLTNRFTFDTA